MKQIKLSFSLPLTVNANLIFYSLACLFLLSACGGGGGGGGGGGDGGTSAVQSDEIFEINDPSSMSKAMSFVGAERIEGNIPSPGTSSDRELDMPSELPLTKNSNTELNIEVPLENTDSRVYGAFVKVDGAEDSFFIPVDSQASISSNLSELANGSIPQIVVGSANISSTASQSGVRVASVGVQCFRNAPPCAPITLEAGALVAGASVSTRQNYPATVQVLTVPPLSGPIVSYGDIALNPNNWSQPIKLELSVTPVKGGEIQVTLTWGTDADIDLYIEEPDGFEIYYGNPNSSSGGFLDVDDTDGYGPENIFYDSAPATGIYSVKVAHYSGTLPTNFSVTIAQNGTQKTYTGILESEEQMRDVALIEVTSNGSDLTGDEDLSVGGRILESGSSTPIENVKVSIAYFSDDNEGDYTTYTDADGRFSLDVNSELLPSPFLVVVAKSGYVPITANVQKGSNDSFALNESLEAAGQDILVVEVDPALHHLGDDFYGGTINSQFQRRTEGTTYTRSFIVSSVQRNYANATLTLTAKGLQNGNTVLVNGSQIGILDTSPSNGSFGDVTFSFPTNIMSSSNTLEIKAAFNSSGDYDDFEFTNALIRFSGSSSNPPPTEAEEPISMLFQNGSREIDWIDGTTSTSGLTGRPISNKWCAYKRASFNVTVTQTAGVGYFITGNVQASWTLGNDIVNDRPLSTGCPSSIYKTISTEMIPLEKYASTRVDSENKLYNALQFQVAGMNWNCYITTPLGSASKLWCDRPGNWYTHDFLLNER